MKKKKEIIKIKKEDLPKQRSGVFYSKIIKNKIKYKRNPKHKKKSSE